MIEERWYDKYLRAFKMTKFTLGAFIPYRILQFLWYSTIGAIILGIYKFIKRR